MQRLWVAGLAWLLVAGVALAAEVPALRGPVNDYAAVISEAQAKELSDFLLVQEKDSSSQIVVLTIRELGDDTIETFAQKVFKAWKLGQVGKNNGVLIVTSIGDHKVRIEVGFGLEGKLTDALSSQIIRHEMTPQFKASKYGDGIMAGAKAVGQAIRGEYQAKGDAAEGWSTVAIVIAIIIIVIVVLIVIYILAKYSDGKGDGSVGDFLSGVFEGSGGDSDGSSYSGGGGDSGGGGASGSW